MVPTVLRMVRGIEHTFSSSSTASLYSRAWTGASLLDIRRFLACGLQ